jgi:septum site-determining protein MinD
MSAVRDADRIIGMLEAEEVKDPWLIVNRIRPDMVKRHDMMNVDDLIDFLKVELLGVVPDDESIIISTNRGIPAVMDEKSRAGRAFLDIASRIMGNDVPIAATLEPDDWFSRFAKWLGISRG